MNLKSFVIIGQAIVVWYFWLEFVFKPMLNLVVFPDYQEIFKTLTVAGIAIEDSFIVAFFLIFPLTVLLILHTYQAIAEAKNIMIFLFKKLKNLS